MAGNTLPLTVKMLKSFMTVGSGLRVPGLIDHSLSMSEKSRSTGGASGARGCTTNMPIVPSPICTISSKCE